MSGGRGAAGVDVERLEAALLQAERDYLAETEKLAARIAELERGYANEVIRAEEAEARVRDLEAAGDKLADDAEEYVRGMPVGDAPLDEALAGWREARRG